LPLRTRSGPRILALSPSYERTQKDAVSLLPRFCPHWHTSQLASRSPQLSAASPSPCFQGNQVVASQVEVSSTLLSLLLPHDRIFLLSELLQWLTGCMQFPVAVNLCRLPLLTTFPGLPLALPGSLLPSTSQEQQFSRPRVLHTAAFVLLCQSLPKISIDTTARSAPRFGTRLVVHARGCATRSSTLWPTPSSLGTLNSGSPSKSSHGLVWGGVGLPGSLEQNMTRQPFEPGSI